MTSKTRIALIALSSIPVISFAAFSTINNILLIISHIIGLSIPVAFAAAILFFLYGVAEFVRNAGNEKEIANGKRLMTWGIIAIFVMVSILGIIRFINGVFGISPTNYNANDIPSGVNNG